MRLVKRVALRGIRCAKATGTHELRNGRRHLQALREDRALTLQADVLRPLDEASEVARGLNILACGDQRDEQTSGVPMPKLRERFSIRGFLALPALADLEPGAAAGLRAEPALADLG